MARTVCVLAGGVIAEPGRSVVAAGEFRAARSSDLSGATREGNARGDRDVRRAGRRHLGARLTMLDGYDHNAPPEVITPILASFFGTRR